MTLLLDRNTEQLDSRTPKTDKYINEYYNSTIVIQKKYTEEDTTKLFFV